ncbi:unnamed protein product [Rangifer tarandus platyrhynchus]|uniref:Uncharacterized protein n=2 Tax=Rangifer tarandus platyrhynchus TaxID=3082113 RepID=A0ABN8ZIA1_RANTA|nr:unnamed protein product [Rangifer tarandus platyrhynchus]
MTTSKYKVLQEVQKEEEMSLVSPQCVLRVSSGISARTELSHFPGNVVQLLISLPELCSLAFWPVSMHASTRIKGLTVLWIMVNICSQCFAILLEPESISRYFSCWQQKSQYKALQTPEPKENHTSMILMHSKVLLSFFLF